MRQRNGTLYLFFKIHLCIPVTTLGNSLYIIINVFITIIIIIVVDIVISMKVKNKI